MAVRLTSNRDANSLTVSNVIGLRSADRRKRFCGSSKSAAKRFARRSKSALPHSQRAASSQTKAVLPWSLIQCPSLCAALNRCCLRFEEWLTVSIGTISVPDDARLGILQLLPSTVAPQYCAMGSISMSAGSTIPNSSRRAEGGTSLTHSHLSSPSNRSIRRERLVQIADGAGYPHPNRLT